MSSERSRGLASVRLDQDAAISHDRTPMAHTHRTAEDGDMAIASRVRLDVSQHASTNLAFRLLSPWLLSRLRTD
jgi:hypothetical protein